MSISNKEKAVALLSSLGTDNQEPIGYINPNKYIQHNLSAPDGLAGFAELLQSLPPGSVSAKVVRAFEDGDYVFTHSEYEFFGPKVGFDIFRFEDGLIVEHWDNLQEITTETASGRSQIDGPAEAADLDKTAENRAFAQSFVDDILINGQMDKITDFISTETYHQHNPAVGDGLAAFGAAAQGMAEAGTPMVYTQNHMLMVQGNFALMVSEGQFLGNHSSFYDLIRIENGKIVEHWDAIETIPAKSEWKNNNGKF